jgi:hypothetical protein
MACFMCIAQIFKTGGFVVNNEDIQHFVQAPFIPISDILKLLLHCNTVGPVEVGNEQMSI